MIEITGGSGGGFPRTTIPTTVVPGDAVLEALLPAPPPPTITAVAVVQQLRTTSDTSLPTQTHQHRCPPLPRTGTTAAADGATATAAESAATTTNSGAPATTSNSTRTNSNAV